MNAIPFREQTNVLAENQPEYKRLPVWTSEDKQQVIFCWQLTLKERLILLVTGRVWHSVLTFGEKLQPQKLTLGYPFMPAEKEPRDYE